MRGGPAITQLHLALATQQVRGDDRRLGKLLGRSDDTLEKSRIGQAVRVQEQGMARADLSKGPVVGRAEAKVGGIYEYGGLRELGPDTAHRTVVARVVHHNDVRHGPKSAGECRHAVRAVKSHDDDGEVVQRHPWRQVRHAGSAWREGAETPRFMAINTAPMKAKNWLSREL